MTDTQNVLRILHLGDLHLDSAFLSLPFPRAEARRAEFREALHRVADLVREREVHIVLLSGDLFDEEAVSRETVATLQEVFGKMAAADIFIAPGNHDPYTPDSLYAANPFPKNVHVFHEEALHKVASERYPVTVSGWAFTGKSLTVSPLSGYQADKDGRLQLVCGHADLDVPLSPYGPVMTADIRAFGADYTALSHRHNERELVKAGKSLYGYSGFFIGRSFDETGTGGAHLLTATQDGAGWTVTAERLSFGERRYEKMTLNVTGAPDASAVLDAVREAYTAKGYGRDTVLRVILEGDLAPDFPMALVEGRLPELGRDLYGISLLDRTSPTYDADILAADMSIRGEVYRSFLPKLTEGTPEERREAALALKLALAALGNGSL